MFKILRKIKRLFSQAMSLIMRTKNGFRVIQNFSKDVNSTYDGSLDSLLLTVNFKPGFDINRARTKKYIVYDETNKKNMWCLVDYNKVGRATTIEIFDFSKISKKGCAELISEIESWV